MKNAPMNPVGPIRNLGRWRLIEDLRKDKTMVLVCGPQFGCGYQIMSADICELHGVNFLAASRSNALALCAAALRALAATEL